jgi:hypothetical protein
MRAIHGLISHGTEAEDIGMGGIVQDHKKLFTATTAQLIEYAFNQKWPGTLDFITHAGTRNITASWPSWVPDWTNEKACSRPTQSYFRVTRKKFDASAGFPMGDANIRIQSYQHGILVLEGKRIDRVHTLCKVFEPKPGLLVTTPVYWEDEALQSKKYPTGADIRYCFSRTLVADSYLEEEPKYSVEFYFLYWTCLKMVLTGRVHVEPTWLEPFVRHLATQYYLNILSACKGQRFFITQGGYFGLCPHETATNDLVVILYGGQSPFILRPTQGGHVLIGDCYVDGVMFGEAARSQNIQPETFTIV